MKIPSSLWTDNTLHLPVSVATDYTNRLNAIGRYDDARGPSPQGEIGGITEEATIEHFVHRFAASAVRTEFLLLDPRKEFGDISSDLIRSLTDGVISILDVPCGAGGGLLGFLGLIHELRSTGILKKLPLNISITAGDCSSSAMELYNQMLTAASPWLNDSGIRLAWECRVWDAKHEPSTASIVDSWFAQSPDSEEWLVLVAAISGELGSEAEKPRLATNSRFFQHICSRMHDRFGGIYWVEPNTNQSNWLLSKMASSVLNSIATVFRQRHHKKSVQFNWQHPLKTNVFSGRIQVLEHRRTGTE